MKVGKKQSRNRAAITHHKVSAAGFLAALSSLHDCAEQYAMRDTSLWDVFMLSQYFCPPSASPLTHLAAPLVRVRVGKGHLKGTMSLIPAHSLAWRPHIGAAVHLIHQGLSWGALQGSMIGTLSYRDMS